MPTMKTKVWVAVICALLAVCVGLSLPMFLGNEPAARARILSDGEVVRTVLLDIDTEFTVPAPGGGHNVVTVRGGAIAVTDATCPDHYCMHRGFCDGGSSIVCLPNRLVIEFLGEQEVDFVVE